MVFYFHPRGYDVSSEGSQDYLIYVGKDKFENEGLIKYGLSCDVWFHVDGLSSAHVYLRLPEGGSIEEIPPETLEDCAQLVKANSIEGCKKNNIDVVYTMWANLKKTAAMDVGQVGFHDNKAVFKVTVAKKNNEIINRLEKTKKELYPDLEAEQEAYMSHARAAKRAEAKAQRAEAKALKEENLRQKDLQSYDRIMKEELMLSNHEIASKYKSAEEMEEDFM